MSEIEVTDPDGAQRQSCQLCLLEGLSRIGIDATPAAMIDFGAIDNDELCATMAHAIEACLESKGWFVKPLAGTFQGLRAQGARITVDALTAGLVGITWPIGDEA